MKQVFPGSQAVRQLTVNQCIEGSSPSPGAKNNDIMTSEQARRVKTWRKRTKDRILQAMGKKCVICGYDRCSDALQVHHLNPSEKDFTFARIRANPITWAKIVEELRKCVLLCGNCHAEVHNGMTKIPDNARRFDESFSQYEKIVGLRPSICECGRKKHKRRNYCSNLCDKRYGIDRIEWSKYDLLEMKKTMTNVAIGKIIGCSNVMISKKLKLLNEVLTLQVDGGVVQR